MTLFPRIFAVPVTAFLPSLAVVTFPLAEKVNVTPFRSGTSATGSAFQVPTSAAIPVEWVGETVGEAEAEDEIVGVGLGAAGLLVSLLPWQPLTAVTTTTEPIVTNVTLGLNASTPRL